MVELFQVDIHGPQFVPDYFQLLHFHGDLLEDDNHVVLLEVLSALSHQELFVQIFLWPSRESYSS